MAFGNNFNNDLGFLNGNDHLNNNGRFVGIAQAHAKTLAEMKTHNNLWDKLTSYGNLELAFRKARKRKAAKPYVVEFEGNLKENLTTLQAELVLKTYKPRQLKTFIVKDPKTRKISKSEFRDRVVHHALCNTIEPIFEKVFIYDTYANRKRKGTLKALKRFDCFKRKVTRNNIAKAFVLKADIRHYFETVNHHILLSIIKTRIRDENVIWLIETILENYGKQGRGMPLGNLTSQFFANVYLSKLDYFVKHALKAKYYIRYVDDFVILHMDAEMLKIWQHEINEFLKKELLLELHKQKSGVKGLERGIDFLGFRCFYYFKLLRKSNLMKMLRRIESFRVLLQNGAIEAAAIIESLQGWNAYAMHANTYKLRRELMNKVIGMVRHPSLQKTI